MKSLLRRFFLRVYTCIAHAPALHCLNISTFWHLDENLKSELIKCQALESMNQFSTHLTMILLTIQKTWSSISDRRRGEESSDISVTTVSLSEKMVKSYPFGEITTYSAFWMWYVAQCCCQRRFHWHKGPKEKLQTLSMWLQLPWVLSWENKKPPVGLSMVHIFLCIYILLIWLWSQKS